MLEIVLQAIQLLRDNGINAQLGFLYHEGTTIPIIVLNGTNLKIGDFFPTEKVVH